MALLQLIDQSWQQVQNSTMLNPFLFSLLVVSFLFLWFKLTRRTQLKLPPSPPKLPIIGNLHQLGSLPHRSLRALSEKYGPLMLLKLGQTPTLVVSSADMVKEMVKAHDVVFSNRTQSTAAHIICYHCTDVAFVHYGEYWRQTKKISVLELLSVKRVQAFQFVREEEVAALVDKTREACLSKSSIDLSEMLLRLSSNIVSRCTLGRKVEEENEKTKFGELTRKVMTQLVAFSFGDMFPSLAWMDVLTGLIARLKETFGELDALLDQIIQEHRTVGIDDQPLRIDFVHVLLQLQKDGMLDIELTQDILKAILMDMVLAGTDTTKILMEWTMTELVRNPVILRKAQEEVRGVVGEKSKIDGNDLKQMGYLKCIIKESLRLHPPAPLSLPRETSASAKLGGYDIPSKTTVLINVWAIQRDPKLWEKPEEFIPERYHSNPIDFKGQDFQLIPFGTGRRACPGISFALAAVEYALANLLYWFDWKLTDGAPGKDLDMSEAYGVTVNKKFALYLVPTLYSP